MLAEDPPAFQGIYALKYFNYFIQSYIVVFLKMISLAMAHLQQ